MRIAIMGSGSIGGYVGARLAERGEDVGFIARGAHLAAMRERGLRVASPYGDVHLPQVFATDAPAEVGVVDLVIFAVKTWDTDEAARQIGPLIGPHTRVLTLQNGIDSVAAVERHVPAGQVVGGIIYVPAVVSAPGVITSPGGPRRMVADGHADDAIIAALGATGSKCVGLDVELSDQFATEMWTKFIRNAAFSAATCITRSRIGAVLAHPESRALVRQLVEEGMAVSAALQYPMPADFAGITMDFFAGLPPTTRASMAEDLEHGRRLEVAHISGRMHQLGLEHGVPTPAHSGAYRALVLHAGGL
jgi:2-dehydropantoate 2-reductase